MTNYSSIIRYAVHKVRSTVTGATLVPAEDLAQEARILLLHHREAWEASALNIEAYARSRLYLALANRAREILRSQGYGTVDGAWGKLRPVLDPAARGTAEPAEVSREATAYGRSTQWARTFREVFPAIAERFLQVSDRAKPDSMSAPEFERRQEARRLRLRAEYAKEIAVIDAIELRADERLLVAVWGVVA